MRIARLAAISLALSAANLSLAPTSPAQELEPRSFANTPVGLNFLIASYGYTDGNVVLNATSPVKDAEVESHSGTIAYVRAIDVFGMSGKVGVIVPFAQASGTAKLAGEPQARGVSGFGDPRVRFSVNFLGAPALTIPEFREYRQDLIIGTNIEITAPLGQYHSDKLLNIGANRWSVKSEIGASKALGRATAEASLAATFFGANNNFLGGQTLKQDPLYAAQGHLIYQFAPGLWASLDGTYYTGGRTRVDGEPGDRLENVRLGATLSVDVSRNQSLKLYASTGAYSRTGLEFDRVGIAWQIRWGGGL